MLWDYGQEFATDILGQVISCVECPVCCHRVSSISDFYTLDVSSIPCHNNQYYGRYYQMASTWQNLQRSFQLKTIGLDCKVDNPTLKRK